ncbi:MAG: hypothetical protein RLZZ196_1845 [Bacteroidota bacterium]|jgi:hypothetical protein
MTTIDQLLLEIVKNSATSIDLSLPKRDVKIIKSISYMIAGAKYITENQSKLLLKLLRENQSKIVGFEDRLTEALTSPIFQRNFRQIEVVKKIYISNSNNQEPAINIEFTYSSQIRKILQENVKKISGISLVNNGKTYQAELTEKNIVAILDLLLPYNFIIDPDLKNHYDTIKSWSKSEVESQFFLTNIVHSNFQKCITADLGLETALDETILIDRSMRYQYIHKNPEKNLEKLENLLACRTGQKVWVDKNKFSLDDVFMSLAYLKRFPLLVVFDPSNSKKVTEDLKNFSEILEKNGIFDNVGIYFRLDNDDAGSEFNNLIKEKKYNCSLSEDTKIVGVQSGKIPKFLLNVDWKPMSVLSFGSQLRHSKTAVYANCCDLIITYSDMQPIVETRPAWE